MTEKITRRDSRILALWALFCWESTKKHPELVFSEVLNEFWVTQDGRGGSSTLSVDDPRLRYARKLFFTASTNADEIDGLISRWSLGWQVSRMPRVDLSIIRLAVAEAGYIKEAPLEVVIDEALELAKEYSTHASPRFVNGVLMGILRELGLTPAPQ